MLFKKLCLDKNKIKVYIIIIKVENNLYFKRFFWLMIGLFLVSAGEYFIKVIIDIAATIIFINKGVLIN